DPRRLGLPCPERHLDRRREVDAGQERLGLRLAELEEEATHHGPVGGQRLGRRDAPLVALPREGHRALWALERQAGELVAVEGDDRLVAERGDGLRQLVPHPLVEEEHRGFARAQRVRALLLPADAAEEEGLAHWVLAG